VNGKVEPHAPLFLDHQHRTCGGGEHDAGLLGYGWRCWREVGALRALTVELPDIRE